MTFIGCNLNSKNIKNMKQNFFFDLADLKFLGKNTIIGKFVRIKEPSKVSIGHNCIIDDFTYISGAVELGDYVHIGASCSIQASNSKITIMDFAAVASGGRLFANSANYVSTSLNTATVPERLRKENTGDPITLEPFAWIGANCVVLPGCKIKTGCVLPALTKLTNSVNLKKWSIYDPATGKCVPRVFSEEPLNEAKNLTGKSYEMPT